MKEEILKIFVLFDHQKNSKLHYYPYLQIRKQKLKETRLLNHSHKTVNR